MCIICCVLGNEAALIHRFLQICEININWQDESDHDIFFMLLFVQKSSTFYAQFFLLATTEVMYWLSCSE